MGTTAAEYATPEGCRVYNSANESIASGAGVALTFDSERYDNGNCHSTASNTSRLTAPKTGKYIITGHVMWASSAAGSFRSISLRTGGSVYIATQNLPVNGAYDEMSLCTIYHLAYNDYVELMVQHDAGVAINVLAAVNHSPEFAMQWVGP